MNEWSVWWQEEPLMGGTIKRQDFQTFADAVSLCEYLLNTVSLRAKVTALSDPPPIWAIQAGQASLPEPEPTEEVRAWSGELIAQIPASELEANPGHWDPDLGALNWHARQIGWTAETTRCDHSMSVPVESSGEVVARLCVQCGTQLATDGKPPPWTVVPVETTPDPWPFLRRLVPIAVGVLLAAALFLVWAWAH